MVHALLASSGFGGVGVWSRFEKIVKEKGYTNAVIIPTAHPKKEKAIWAQETKRQMESLGISVRFFDIEFSSAEEIKEDIIYVCGGNTYTLLKWAKENNLKKGIESLWKRGGLYIGSSAGSIILSPSIAVAGEIPPGDKNTVGLKDTTGFGYIPFHLIVHYEPSDAQAVSRFKKKHMEDVEVLPNGEALYIYGDHEERIEVL